MNISNTYNGKLLFVSLPISLWYPPGAQAKLHFHTFTGAGGTPAHSTQNAGE